MVGVAVGVVVGCEVGVVVGVAVGVAVAVVVAVGVAVAVGKFITPRTQSETEVRIVSQLEALCNKLKIRVDCERVSEIPEYWKGSQAYEVTLRFRGRRLLARFYQGPAYKQDPKVADVLYCLSSDARCGEQSFDDFCSDLGYDNDSRKAEKTWLQCKAMAPKLRRFLGTHFDDIARLVKP